MYKIEAHNRMNQMISLFYYTGPWENDNRSDCRKWFFKVIYLSACVYYPIGLIGASLLRENKIESIFMGVASILTSVQLIRIYYYICNQGQIIELVRTLGSHIIRKKELNQLYLDINIKIKRLVNFGTIFFLMVFVEVLIILTIPFISNERQLPLNIYFPLNWKENEIVYWFAFGFIAYALVMYSMCAITNVIIWYLMMSCVIKYETLANEMKLMGVVSVVNLTLITLIEKQKLFLEELFALIKNHQQLQQYNSSRHTILRFTTFFSSITDKFKTTFSNLFFIQIITSGLLICGTLFSLAFITTKNPFEYATHIIAVVYIAFEIFMVTYFGNEIKVWSSRLSYCLFECDWVDQSQSFKQRMIILMEVLKRPQLLIIGKLYPLDLQIFTKILNFAYSMFNVLMHFK